MGARLTIDAADLRDAVRPILRASKLSAANEITFTFEEGELVISREGVAASVPATGEWTGMATISARVLPMLTRVEGGAVEVSFEGDLLKIGKMTFEGRWHGGAQFGVDVPLELSLFEILALRVRYSDEALVAHGLFDRVMTAERELQRLVGNASHSLNVLGNFRSGIEELVRAKLRESVRNDS